MSEPNYFGLGWAGHKQAQEPWANALSSWQSDGGLKNKPASFFSLSDRILHLADAAQQEHIRLSVD